MSGEQEEDVRKCFCGKTENWPVCGECLGIVRDMCRRNPEFKEEVHNLIALWKRNYQLVTELEQREAVEEVERMLRMEDSGTTE